MGLRVRVGVGLYRNQGTVLGDSSAGSMLGEATGSGGINRWLLEFVGMENKIKEKKSNGEREEKNKGKKENKYFVLKKTIFKTRDTFYVPRQTHVIKE